MSDVKRYDPINSDGTCGTCVEDPGYGAYVEFADYAALEAELATVKKVAYGNMELLDENRNLQAELAKLRAGQEPVAYTTAGMLAIAKELPLTGRIGARCKADDRWNVPLYTAPQPSAVPDGWKLVPVEPTPEMVSAAEEAHMPFGDMDIALRMAILSAPSTPATVQGDGWIPVSERLPEPETDVLVRGVRRNEVMHNVAGVFNGEWSSQETEDLIRGEVTHWMPLPAAPGRQEVK